MKIIKKQSRKLKHALKTNFKRDAKQQSMKIQPRNLTNWNQKN